jgi:hypothetical protein
MQLSENDETAMTGLQRAAVIVVPARRLGGAPGLDAHDSAKRRP